MSNFIDAISKLSPSERFKPHKYIALLTAIKIVSDKNFLDNKIFFDDNYKIIFSTYFRKFASSEDKNRPHAPFFHLRSSGLIVLVPNDGVDLKKVTTVGCQKELNEAVLYAKFSDSFFNALKDNEGRKNIIYSIFSILNKKRDEGVCTFLDYLSSLQRLSGGNENALAEFQACSEFFSCISTPPPLLSAVVTDMLQGDAHIILTGHAGDGKTTLAFAAYKELIAMSADTAFTEYLPVEKYFEAQGKNMLLVKDLSEHALSYRPKLLQKLLENTTTALLVSNTGSLLDFFISQAENHGENPLEVEMNVLRCLESESGVEFSFGQKKFKMYNLALWDNIASAHKIFMNILHDDNWKNCISCVKSSECPVHTNRIVLKEKRVLQRVVDVYTRLRAYGTRLTLRQLTEHFSYCLTGGLRQQDLCTAAGEPPAYVKFAFFNLFFGDSMTSKHQEAENMAAIKAISKQSIGVQPFTQINKKLWYMQQLSPEEFGTPDSLHAYFIKFHKVGSRHTKAIASASARLQLRRLLYFCHDAPLTAVLCRSVREEFLASPATVLYGRIKEISSFELRELEDKLFHVLLEHCTGITLPQDIVSSQKEKRLYLTLNRLEACSRKSVQILYGSLSWEDNFRLEIYAHSEKSMELRLVGHERAEGIYLSLDIPFLDYVLRRNNGELGGVLHSSFLQRLDNFKANIAPCCITPKKNEMKMLRYLSDYTLTTDEFSFVNDKLEVR